ncbi:MAG: BBP7 family outer membrane beta-barrel protein [Planctomycetaceae bacterium]|nr:BBP7 family outer membrane beta-barrel protein [Planctomycetaceae bacterium]
MTDDALDGVVCSLPGRYWLRADYLLWWGSGMKLPPLVSTGVLSSNSTQILYGNDTVLDGGRSGYRTTVGTWLDCCHVWDLEFDYLSLGELDANYTSPNTSGSTVIMRPFFDVQSNTQSGELVSSPGLLNGTVSVHAKDYFQSAGVLLSYNLCSCDGCCTPCDDPCAIPLLNCCRTDLLFGFRYYDLSDYVGITENLTVTGGTSSVLGTTFLIHDNFNARNQFYGGELGLRTELYRGRWSLNVTTKIALGNTHQTINIAGEEYKTVPNQSTQYYNYGIFAGRTNDGSTTAEPWPHPQSRDVFTIIPQLNLELGYQMTRHWRAFVGYSILYWGNVIRAADQIDLNVDPRNWPEQQSGALPFPAFTGKTSSYYAQGLNVGAEFRF